MRNITLWLTAAAALPVAGYVSASAAGLLGPGLAGAGASQTVNRQSKSSRLAVAPRPAEQAGRIASVEVVGLDSAAIVYRDRSGRVLFKTDPLANATVVARGVSLPVITVRHAPKAATVPLVIEAPAAERPDRTPPRPQKLPRDCEPAASPLSALGASDVEARCFVDLGASKFVELR
ncbi:MAG: hypothetical protein IT538_08115 [Variibacter sp.]|nr:hypothetical protein [Variibacter sp.]